MLKGSSHSDGLGGRCSEAVEQRLPLKNMGISAFVTIRQIKKMQQSLLIRLPNEVLLEGTDYHHALSNSLLFVSILLLVKLIDHHSNQVVTPLAQIAGAASLLKHLLN